MTKKNSVKKRCVDEIKAVLSQLRNYARIYGGMGMEFFCVVEFDQKLLKNRFLVFF